MNMNARRICICLSSRSSRNGLAILTAIPVKSDRRLVVQGEKSNNVPDI